MSNKELHHFSSVTMCLTFLTSEEIKKQTNNCLWLTICAPF